jgi:hypothetical protein
MGFGMEEEECRQDAHAPWEEAIRKHLRSELVNRLTKIVPFKPLGMDTAREILGKLIAELNGRLEERGETVELDASAEDLILQEGYSEEYGARSLERAVDRLLGTLISGKLLSGEITSEMMIQIEAVDGEIRVGVRFEPIKRGSIVHSLASKLKRRKGLRASRVEEQKKKSQLNINPLTHYCEILHLLPHQAAAPQSTAGTPRLKPNPQPG